MRLALAVAAAVLTCAVASAATVTVAPGGSDANAGTEAAPFATIPAAAKSLQPGDTLLIKAGTYAGGISINLRGTPDKPITIKAAGDGPVVIEGRAGNIMGWEPDPPAVQVVADTGPAVGLALSGENLRLEGLTVRRFAAQGIIVGSAHNVTISRCTVSHCGAVWSAGIQLAQTADVTVENCLLYHLRNGIIAQDADRTRLVHDTIYHTRAHGVYLITGQGAVLRDNILYAGGGSGSALYLDPRGAGGLQADYNCYLDTGTPALVSWMPLNLRFPTFWDYRETIRSQDQHSFSADPLFVSTTPEREDFHLQPNSPCRGKASDGGDMGVAWGP